MTIREPLIRAKRFKIEEAHRRLAQIDAMVGEFERMASDLERDIAAEENRTGITDPRHFAYSPVAGAARQRRENLVRSCQDLRVQRADAQEVLAQAEAQLHLAEAAGERERAAEADGFDRRQIWRREESARL